MNDTPLRLYVTQTYFALRLTMAGIALSLPLVLLFVGQAIHSGPQPTSISGYYHTPMRNAFVGALVVLGTFLVLYRTVNRVENWLLNLAGAAVLAVAFLPCAPDQGATDAAGSPFTAPAAHGICALIAFGCLAVVSVFLGRDTLSELPDDQVRRRFRTVYVVLGGAMIAAPVLAVVLAYHNVTWLFWVETAALWVFAVFWLVKTWEYYLIDPAANRGRLASLARWT